MPPSTSIRFLNRIVVRTSLIIFVYSSKQLLLLEGLNFVFIEPFYVTYDLLYVYVYEFVSLNFLSKLLIDSSV
ncbi:hypothetical protein CW304_24145 [Bacillus sp. UFRGS-B20]|nr:hypothetical protein CW304_24145 [Bacillus sp. UFRGS-B20]